MRRSQYEIVLIDTFAGAGFLFASAAALIARIVGKPYVLVLHGGNLPHFLRDRAAGVVAALRQILRPHHLYGRALLIPSRRVLASAARLVSPSPYLAERIGEQGFEVLVIPNSIDVEKYAFRHRRTAQPRLLWVRSFNHVYNPLLAIRVLAEIKQVYPNAMLTMVGPDKGELHDCKTLARDLKLTESVFFPGLMSKSEISCIALEHDIFINTSNVDNTPVSVIEAMAMGIPIVSTNAGGLPYLLAHERNGILVKPDDADAMASAVMRLLGDGELVSRLSANGRIDSLAYDWPNVFPMWKALVRSVSMKSAS